MSVLQQVLVHHQNFHQQLQLNENPKIRHEHHQSM
jgi:hypothetical protein